MARKILIIDDNDADRAALSEILGSEFSVLEANGSEEGIAILRKKNRVISAVVLDVMPPALSGFTLLRRIKEHSIWSQIPVFIAVDDEDEDTQARALALGAHCILNKRAQQKVLLFTIRNTIGLCETAAIVNTLRHDKLTGIFNREAFFETAKRMIARHDAGYYIMSCFDIDGFKVINDQYGMEKGDDVLKHVAVCINECVASIDGVCCRFMGDKFAAMYPAFYKSSEVMKESHDALRQPDCISRPIRIRIGRYVIEDTELSVSAMYDRAMLAQESIKGRYDVYIAEYDEAMRMHLLHEQQIVLEMHDALRNGQFETWYQPQFNHATGALIGAEALVRWRHPKNGLLIPPGDFIPVFERNGFIYELDKYVWEQTCRVLRDWIDAGKTPLPISVNISRYDVFHRSFVGFITGLVRDYGIPIELLHLEITESAFATSTEQIVAKIKELIVLGFVVEIDDFGSGYSSLNTLKDVPATVLKLDMRFLENREDSQRGGNILESIVRMAKWLGMTVTAEGVETKAQADYLKSIGCFYVQGYYYAQPMPLDEYEKLIWSSRTENRMNHLETVETLDNSAFWDPKSMDTLIFNSYVGGACIIEYHAGRTEVIRQNDRFAQEFAGKTIDGRLVAETPPVECLDRKNLDIMFSNIKKAINTRRESTCEVSVSNIDGEKDVPLFLSCTVRVIAKTEVRYLLYCVVNNVTAQRLAERKEHQLAEQLSAFIDNMYSGVSANVISHGHGRFLFANSLYYTQLGYTRDQYRTEVKSVYDLVHPADVEETQRRNREVIETRRPASIKYRVIQRDGNTRWFESRISMVTFAHMTDPVQLTITNDITMQMEAERALCARDEQLSFLNDMAHDLLAQPDADMSIMGTLRKLLGYFEASRSYIFEIDAEKDEASNTYEVCAAGVTEEKGNLQDIPLSHAPAWFASFDTQNYVRIDSVDMLDDSRPDKAMLKAQGISALMAVPLKREGSLFGFLGIDDPKRQMAQVDLLVTLGDYIAVMLTRRDLTARLSSS